jgi:hypothetical protein
MSDFADGAENQINTRKSSSCDLVTMISRRNAKTDTLERVQLGYGAKEALQPG